MLRVRHSTQIRGNAAVKLLRKTSKEKNEDWISRAASELTADVPKVLLLGGTRLIDFRLRVAQSVARRDVMPSFWNHAAVFFPARGRARPQLWHVPLEVGDDLSSVPRNNGVLKSSLKYVADGKRWQNLALIEFPGVSRTVVTNRAMRLRFERLNVDLVSPLLEWLGHAWGVAGTESPLSRGIAVPSASYVETVFASSDIDLAPGMADRTVCPEAIWQSSKWWSEFYAGDQKDAVPAGRFNIGQGAAAILAD